MSCKHLRDCRLARSDSPREAHNIRHVSLARQPDPPPRAFLPTFKETCRDALATEPAKDLLAEQGGADLGRLVAVLRANEIYDLNLELRQAGRDPALIYTRAPLLRLLRNDDALQILVHDGGAEGVHDGHNLVLDARTGALQVVPKAFFAPFEGGQGLLQRLLLQKGAVGNSDEQPLPCGEARHGQKQLVARVDPVEGAPENNIVEDSLGHPDTHTLVPAQLPQGVRAGSIDVEILQLVQTLRGALAQECVDGL
mmetsp:Transcript_8241/g.20471  ORF Transcript_8241/g.20471 Transcript_8241/m.20471 type:complete len:254 (-) Transcript_8241:532-1293(-)